MSLAGQSLQAAFSRDAGQVRSDPKADMILSP